MFGSYDHAKVTDTEVLSKFCDCSVHGWPNLVPCYLLPARPLGPQSQFGSAGIQSRPGGGGHVCVLLLALLYLDTCARRTKVKT